MKLVSILWLLAVLSASATLTGQNHCTTPATIVPGVECNLVSTAGGLLLPCTSPIGFYYLPVGTSLLIDHTPSSCVSFCLQGIASDIFCAQVEGGEYHELCAGQSLSLGDQGQPGSTYVWEPALYISCTNCPATQVSPPSDAIYLRTETTASGAITVTFYNIEVITCTGTGAPGQAQVRVAPVPATDEIMVEAFDFDRYVITDFSGRMVQTGSGCQVNTIRVGELPAGIYYLRLWNGGKTLGCKFLKGS